MALSLGSLFVKLNADTSNLTKGLEGAGQKIAQFGQKVEGITSKLGGIGVAMAAFGANAVRIGAQLDGEVGAAVRSLQGAFNALNSQVARALLPVIRTLADVIQTISDAFNKLTPSQKEFIAQFGAAVAIGLALAAAVGKVIAAVTALAPVVEAVMAAVVTYFGWPVIAIGAIIAALPLLITAFEENWGGIADTFKNFVDYMSQTWKKFVDWFGSMGTGMFQVINTVFKTIFETFRNHVDAVLSLVEGALRSLGVTEAADAIRAHRELMKDVGQRGFVALFENMKAGAGLVVDAYVRGGNYAYDKIKAILGEIGTLSRAKAVPGGGAAAGAGGYGPGINPAGIVNTQKELAQVNEAILRTNEKLNASFAELSSAAIHVPSDMMKQITDAFAEAMKAQDWETATGILNNLKALEDGLADAAEQQRLLAKKIEDTAREALGGIASTIASKFGALQEVGQMAAQGAQAGMVAGPAGAVAGGIAGGFLAILMQSKNFQRIVDQTAIMFGGLFEAFGELLGPIADLMTAVNVVNARQNLPMLRDAFKKLADVLRFFLLVFNDGLYALNTIIGKAMFLIADAIGWVLPEVANNLRNFGSMILDGLDAEREEFAAAIRGEGTDFVAEGMAKLGESAADAAVGLASLNDAIGNAPSGFKLAGYKYNLGEPVGDFTPLQINISVDGKEMQARVMEVSRRAYFVNTGGFLPPRP